MAALCRCPWPLAVGLVAVFSVSCKKTSFAGRDATEPTRKQSEKSPGELDASKGGKNGDPSPNELDANGNPKAGTNDGTARGPNGELLPGGGTGGGTGSGTGNGTLGQIGGSGGQNDGTGGTVGGTQRGPNGEIIPTDGQSGTGGGSQSGTGTTGGTSGGTTGGTTQGGGSQTSTVQGPTGGVPGGTVDCGPRFQTIQTAGGPITVDTSYNPTTPVIVSQASSKDTTCTVYVRESVPSQGTTTTLVREGQGLHYSYRGTEQTLANAYRYCTPSARGLAVGVSEKIFAIANPVPAPGSLTPAPTQNGACVARKVIDGAPSPDTTWFIVIP